MWKFSESQNRKNVRLWFCAKNKSRKGYLRLGNILGNVTSFKVFIGDYFGI